MSTEHTRHCGEPMPHASHIWGSKSLLCPGIPEEEFTLDIPPMPLEVAWSEDLVDSPTLCALAGLSFRQADYWTRRGYLRPVEADPGQGNPRQWAMTEVQIAELMALLGEVGFTVEAAARSARAYIEDGTEEHALTRVMISAAQALAQRWAEAES